MGDPAVLSKLSKQRYTMGNLIGWHRALRDVSYPAEPYRFT